MKYNGISFNADFYHGKTLDDFIANEGHHGLPQKQLREAFYLINPKKHGNDKRDADKGAGNEAE